MASRDGVVRRGVAVVDPAEGCPHGGVIVGPARGRRVLVQPGGEVVREPCSGVQIEQVDAVRIPLDELDFVKELVETRRATEPLAFDPGGVVDRTPGRRR